MHHLVDLREKWDTMAKEQKRHTSILPNPQKMFKLAFANFSSAPSSPCSCILCISDWISKIPLGYRQHRANSWNVLEEVIVLSHPASSLWDVANEALNSKPFTLILLGFLEIDQVFRCKGVLPLNKPYQWSQEEQGHRALRPFLQCRPSVSREILGKSGPRRF